MFYNFPADFLTKSLLFYFRKSNDKIGIFRCAVEAYGASVQLRDFLCYGEA